MYFWGLGMEEGRGFIQFHYYTSFFPWVIFESQITSEKFFCWKFKVPEDSLPEKNKPLSVVTNESVHFNDRLWKH